MTTADLHQRCGFEVPGLCGALDVEADDVDVDATQCAGELGRGVDEGVNESSGRVWVRSQQSVTVVPGGVVGSGPRAWQDRPPALVGTVVAA